MKYRIRFTGCPKGRLNTAMKDVVTKIVEADTVEEARLKAYDIHEHIVGGLDGVSVDRGMQ